MNELSPFLQPINSPITQDDLIDSSEFESTNERGAISGIFIQDLAIGNAKIGTAAIGTANIGTLTFNEIAGGTVTLGGTLNGSGLLIVNDEGGTQVGKWDKDGIEVKTTAGTTIIDGGGLISSANFVSASTVSLNDSRTTGSTSFVDVSDTTLSVVLSRTTNVLFLAYGDFANAIGQGETSSEFVALNIGGTLFPDASNGFGNVFFAGDVGTAEVTTVLATWHGHFLASLGAGTHTAKLQFRKQGTHGTAEVDARVQNTGLTYIIMGT